MNKLPPRSLPSDSEVTGIIARLPRNDIRNAAQVSQTWRKLINASKLVKKMRAFKPLRIDDFAPPPPGRISYVGLPGREKTFAESSMDVPHYCKEHDVKLNPVLEPSGDFDRILIDLPEVNSSRPMEVSSQFISEPPITSLRMEIVCSRNLISSCILYINTGITLADIDRTRTALFRSERYYGLNRPLSARPQASYCAAYLRRNVDLTSAAGIRSRIGNPGW